MRRFLLSLVCLLVCSSGFSASLLADQGEKHDGVRPPIHVQLVLDSSGSMNQNDPKKLSILAAMMFTDLAGPNDQVGVLTMKRNQFTASPIKPVATQRDKIRKSIRSVKFLGPTFCAQPLDEALEGLQSLNGRGAEQFVIFLSDGVCPIATPGADLDLTAKALKSAGVRVFTIALQPPGKENVARDLNQVAERTNGEFFSITESKDLPTTFAKILGRIVGSEAQTIDMRSGSGKADLDGFAHDASFIATGSRTATYFTSAEGPQNTSIKIAGARVPFTKEGNDYFVSSHENGSGRYYSVLRLDEPASGTWRVKAKVPPDVTGILIQNFAIDPVIEVSQRDVAAGTTVKPKVWLRGKEGVRLSEDRFLRKIAISMSVKGPDGTTTTVEMPYKSDGFFEGEMQATSDGTYELSARATMKKGGLNKTSNSVEINVASVTLRLTDPNQTLDLGTIKAGERSQSFTIDLSASDYPREAPATMDSGAITDIEVEPTEGTVSSKSPNLDVTFWVRPKHEGGAFDSTLKVTSGLQVLEIPVRGEVVPLSFWERFRNIILTIGLGCLALLLLLFVAYGFLSPHSFGADARLNWGESMRRLNKNEIVIREIPGTGKGFYKNAKLVIGGTSSFLPVDGTEVAVLEATGKNQITISTLNGVELLSINKFDEKKSKPVDGNLCFMNTGELYQIASLFIRLQ